MTTYRIWVDNYGRTRGSRTSGTVSALLHLPRLLDLSDGQCGSMPTLISIADLIRNKVRQELFVRDDSTEHREVFLEGEALFLL
jgi:hypothetical protein